jgi:hypothetical protein
MKTTSRFMAIFSVLLVFLGLFCGAFFPGATVEAKSAPASVKITPRPTLDLTALEDWLKREQITLENQAERLKASNQVISHTNQLIEKQKAAGKDTAALETSLGSFSKAVGETQVLHDNAAEILSSHAGFDANGKVIDAKQALQTLHNAGLPLREGHLKITQATLDFRQAVRAYVQANQ